MSDIRKSEEGEEVLGNVEAEEETTYLISEEPGGDLPGDTGKIERTNIAHSFSEIKPSCPEREVECQPMCDLTYLKGILSFKVDNEEFSTHINTMIIAFYYMDVYYHRFDIAYVMTHLNEFDFDHVVDVLNPAKEMTFIIVQYKLNPNTV